MADKTNRIGLFGYFGSGNLGNEGSLEAMIKVLKSRRPDTELVCICIDPHEAQKQHGIKAVDITPPDFEKRSHRILNRILLKVPRRLHAFHHAYRVLRTLDAVIVPGTGILDDFGERPTGMPYAIFRWTLLARLMNRPFALISIGAGPILHPVNRWLMKSAARLAHIRTYRDQLSKDFMTRIGVDTSKDKVYPDLAFGLSHQRAHQKDPTPANPVTVGVGVMEYLGWIADDPASEQIYNTYLNNITSFIIGLLKQRHNVRIMIGQQSDWLAVEEITGRIKTELGTLPPGQLETHEASSLHDVMTQMDATDIVVATRYHNVVCALNACKPTISLGYAEKNDVLLADMGLEDYCQHIEQLDIDLLESQFKNLLSNREAYAKQIEQKLQEYRERLAEQDTHILAELL